MKLYIYVLPRLKSWLGAKPGVSCGNNSCQLKGGAGSKGDASSSQVWGSAGLQALSGGRGALGMGELSHVGSAPHHTAGDGEQWDGPCPP